MWSESKILIIFMTFKLIIPLKLIKTKLPNNDILSKTKKFHGFDKRNAIQLYLPERKPIKTDFFFFRS